MRRGSLRASVFMAGLAVLASVSPVIIAPDFLVRQATPITDHDLKIRVFRALVVPVVRAYQVAGIAGGYEFLIDPPEFADYSPRPSTMALGHLVRAIPFWLVALFACYWGIRSPSLWLKRSKRVAN